MPTPCYVVLHHTGIGDPHFDLLIDLDGVSPLLSWRLMRWPINDGDPIELRSPHRRLYLEFEGDVSRGRGHVRRVASGGLRLEEQRAGSIRVGLGEKHAIVTLPLSNAFGA